MISIAGSISGEVIEECRKKEIDDDHQKDRGDHRGGCPPADLFSPTRDLKALIGADEGYHNTKDPCLEQPGNNILNQKRIHCLLEIIVRVKFKGRYCEQKTAEDPDEIRDYRERRDHAVSYTHLTLPT